MSKAKYTPGKMELDTDDEMIFIVNYKGQAIAQILHVFMDLQEHDAIRLVDCWNAMEGIDDPAAARVVLDEPQTAAAADMLDALKRAIEALRRIDPVGLTFFEQEIIIDAINKAEGRS